MLRHSSERCLTTTTSIDHNDIRLQPTKAGSESGSWSTRVGTGLDRHWPCIHARGWPADHGPVAVAQVRYPRLACRPALCPVPRSPARRRVAGQGRGRILEGDLSAARPLTAEL